MEKNNTKIENLISGGLIGAAFGAFLAMRYDYAGMH